MDETTVSADYSFESRFLDILGSKMHYIETGEGRPILFLLLSRSVFPPKAFLLPSSSPGSATMGAVLVGSGCFHQVVRPG